MGCTPLHNAAMNSHLEVMTILIQAGASLDEKDNDDVTPRQLLKEKDLEQLEAIGSEITYKNWNGTTQKK